MEKYSYKDFVLIPKDAGGDIIYEVFKNKKLLYAIHHRVDKQAIEKWCVTKETSHPSIDDIEVQVLGNFIEENEY